MQEPTFSQQLSDLLAANSELLTGFTIVYTWITDEGRECEAWDAQTDQSLMATLGQLEWAKAHVLHDLTVDQED